MQIRLFPRIPGVQFERPVHEDLRPSLQRLGIRVRQVRAQVVNRGGSRMTRQKGQGYCRTLQRWLCGHPEDHWARHYVAQQQCAEGRLEEPLVQYQIIIERAGGSDPKLTAIAHLMRGVILLDLDRDPDAWEELSRASLFAPSDALVLLAQAQLSLSRDDRQVCAALAKGAVRHAGEETLLPSNARDIVRRAVHLYGLATSPGEHP